MTLDKAIELLRANYKTALNLKWVRKPLAWALYQTWHEADSRLRANQAVTAVISVRLTVQIVIGDNYNAGKRIHRA